MNAAKRKQPAGPLTRLVTGFVPFLQGPWLVGLKILGLVGVLVGGAFYGWDRWGADILQRPSYVLTADQIEITPPPSWIRSEIKTEAVRDGNLEGLTVLDKDLTLQVARAFKAHTWIEDVTRVSKHHPARVQVEIIYRKPVAMVEVVISDKAGLLPVDVFGILLPPGDFSAEQARDYLRIAQPPTGPTGIIGDCWGDDSVHEAVRIAAVLQNHWKQCGLYRIEVHGGRPNDSSAPRSYDLVTRQGSRVFWGDAPNPTNAANMQNAGAKLAQLIAYVDQHGPLDSLATPVELDLRLPATAAIPSNDQREIR